MKRLDTVCAWLIFGLGAVHIAMTPGGVSGRLWFFGTGLALIFAGMINLLRIKNGYAVEWLKAFCVSANAMTLVLAVFSARALLPRLARYPQVFVIVAAAIFELVLSARQRDASR